MSSAIDTLLQADQARVSAAGDGLCLPVQGLEAVVAGALAALPQGAWWVPGPREAVGAVLRGANAERVQEATRGARPYKVAPASTAPALRALQAVGLAHAAEGPALVHLGIGSVSDGAFAEALNLAALLEAPVVFLVAVHPLDGDAPLGPQSAASPEALASAFGLSSFTVDGRDADAVESVVRQALDAGNASVITANL